MLQISYYNKINYVSQRREHFYVFLSTGCGDEAINISNIDGVVKRHINTETCRLYWSKSRSDCNVCINVCPYNKPDTWFHSCVRWCGDNLRWGNPFYMRADKNDGI